MQWLVQLIGYIPRSPESSSLLQFPVDEHSQNQSFRELLSSSVQPDNEPITVAAPAADGELCAQTGCASPVAAVSIPPFSLSLQLGKTLYNQSLPRARTSTDYWQSKKRGKKTLSKPEYKSPVIKQWHSRGGEANLRCWAWLCPVGCDPCASGTGLLWGFMPLQLRTRNYSFLVWGVSKWTAIVETAN